METTTLPFNAIKILNKTHAINPAHFHTSNYELLYVVSGQFKYFINNTSYNYSEGDVILVKKSTIHNAIINPNIPCTYYFLTFTEDLINQECLNILNDLFRYYHICTHSDSFLISLLFSKICKEFSNKPKFWCHNTRYQLNELIILLYRLSLTSAATNIDDNSMITQSINVINECVQKQSTALLSLVYLSSLVHLSPSSFSKKFKKETGINYKQYVLSAQIIYAQSLIRTTTLPITEVAYQSGFIDSNYFSTVFKRITGNTPSQYASYERRSTR